MSVWPAAVHPVAVHPLWSEVAREDLIERRFAVWLVLLSLLLVLGWYLSYTAGRLDHLHTK